MHHGNWSLCGCLTTAKAQQKNKQNSWFIFKMLYFRRSSSLSPPSPASTSKLCKHVQNSLISPNNLKNKHSENRRFGCLRLLSIRIFHFARRRFRLSWGIIDGISCWFAFVHAIQSNYIAITHSCGGRKNNRNIINNRQHFKSNRITKKAILPSRCPNFSPFGGAFIGAIVGIDLFRENAYGE